MKPDPDSDRSHESIINDTLALLLPSLWDRRIAGYGRECLVKGLDVLDAARGFVRSFEIFVSIVKCIIEAAARLYCEVAR